MTLERPMSLQAILRNERRRIIAAAIRRELDAGTLVLEAFSRIAAECKASNEEVLHIMDQMIRGDEAQPTYAQ
jgi:hypothetical protein